MRTFLTYLILAWRNIWRNKRRTAITAASVAFALLFALVMRSAQKGSYSNMINNLVQAYTGYIQIHKAGYWKEKDINHVMPLGDTLRLQLRRLEHVTDVVPRLESFALASYGLQTKGIMIAGIQPEEEDRLTHLAKKVIRGKYLDRTGNGVLIAGKLASFLKIGVNDTLVLISQGYHGISAADKFPVTGIIHFPSPDLDNEMVYMTLQNAGSFFSAPSMVTSVSLDLEDQADVAPVAAALRRLLPPDSFEVMTWDELLKEVVQQIKVDNVSGLIFLGILYVVIAFGIFGTVLMMTTERIREFGVMVALGMQKVKLTVIVFFEMLLIGFLGIFCGILGSIPVILYYYYHPVRLAGETARMIENYGIEPVMPFAFQADYFVNQSLVVFIFVVLAIIYPVWIISRMRIIKALRNKI